jgi:hypothetical protein
MASGSAVAMATVLYLSVPSGDEFGAYYPKKLVYILLIVFGLLALSFAIGAIGDRVRLSLIAIICVLAVLAAAVLPPGTWPETIQRQPVARILGDYVRHDGEQTVREILRFASDTHPTVLWQSGYPDEPIVNEWVVLSHGGLIHGDKKLIALVGGAYFLFRGSGRYSDRQVSTLCTILPRLPGSPIVRTANPGLGVELTKDCPGVRVRVIVDTSLVGPLPSKTGENWETDGIEGPFH